MAKCTDCDDDMQVEQGSLCQHCRQDRVLNDMMRLTANQQAQVVAEGLAYPGVVQHMKGLICGD